MRFSNPFLHIPSSRRLGTPLMAFSCFLALSTVGIAAEEEKEEVIFLDPAKAGPDFAIQGEYVGEIPAGEETHKWGAQIVALGDGEFQLTGYQGGLPGAGWTSDRKKIHAQGKLAKNVVVFITEDDEEGARYEEGKLLALDDGEVRGTLKKIERKSPTLGAKPPEGAIVLFDGSSANHFEEGEMTEEGLLLAGTASKMAFGDHALHVEFRTPFKPFARGQARGNSGVYLQSRYECQVLDSFGLKGLDNECGGIYQIQAPKVNMCLPPLSWQTYDIEFTAARYDAKGEKTRNARITIKHNGTVIHDDLELPHGTPGRLPEGPEKAPLYLQGHGNPVTYRNIWVMPHDRAE